MLAVGANVVFKPEIIKKMMDFWKQGKRLYFSVIIRAGIGIIFLLAAAQARWPMFLYALGILAIIKGLFVPAIGLERVKKLMGWWEKQPVVVLRLLGLLTAVIGVLVIYSM